MLGNTYYSIYITNYLTLRCSIFKSQEACESISILFLRSYVVDVLPLGMSSFHLISFKLVVKEIPRTKDLGIGGKR